MKNVLKKYIRSVLREEIELGRVAFGGERKDEVPYEEDTPSEAQLLQSVIGYLDDAKQLKTNEIDAIRRWLSSEAYPDMFVPPQPGTIYRAVSMSYDRMSKVTGLSLEEITAATKGVNVKRGSSEASYSVVSRGGGVTSWTTELNTALYFGRAESNKTKSTDKSETVIVVFEANTDDNIGNLLDITPIYTKVDNPLMMKRSMEKEVWGLGPIACNRVRWYERF
jgi:hypothetical protein